MLSMQPYLDKINKCYKNIIVINNKPEGKLQNIVKQINPPKISPFKSSNLCCHSDKCIFALLSFKNNNELMCIDEIPNLFNFLLSNNYNIDTSVTKMMFKSEIKFDNKLICFISKKN